MAAINIPDIYGRNYLINFDTVKYIQVSDNEECGDLIITFTDRSRQVISVGLDRKGAADTFERISRVMGSASLTGQNKLWR
ncbi:hypothetical protein FX488_16580 [Salmonella enterica]|nr:hypothetical protein [Salmonella enterica]EBS4438573.1 hypothetical protein [Salmonella enterica subsp. enterica serovar Guinea]EBX3950043.1 hypothetical protein [Salmonella enterica subsp. enterica serovar Offa]EDP9247196.1 hypothetical protein [Salmonella enterica subsp. enterica serovar Cotham]EDU0857681.1 hypothetical protein [Salmonella enterica subsp. enterica serovar Mountpleasant]EHG6518298.1 hypothetical protein [Salmonella enterica subsp. enterica serovar 44:z10:1,7]